MAYEYRRHSSHVLNLTPLIDIVFLLLVFFMLTAHFIEDEAIDIQLPEAISSQSSQEDQPLVISLLPSGEILLDGESIPLVQLEKTLSAMLHANSKRVVQLKGDRTAQFGLAIKIIDAARSAGAESLDILTEKP
ncbi:MAG: biopolymer transporter ExbD [Candidatus Thiodiazotropha lotti]|nr:biopolymer transporter ExbD [Candidatus Thiodiazotropha lotti]MCG7999000.1 biopolymer transporter ExbD [Candidatus Thiodiazotropha lotti]MCW4182017.1 biopolymer transporter ExbD [Candidatus Thiodiazotropha weberae]MCW4190768.1 biopolymer transporter ExbD [Candidatus Thiodiazotropha weberae]